MTIGNLENFDANTLKFTVTPLINTSGKYTKIRRGKCRQLTKEMARQIEHLLAWNYRPRRIQHKINGKWLNRKVTPMPKITYPLFAPYHSEASE